MTQVAPEIQLSNGKFYSYANPNPDVLDVETIAHALANACRFSGHCSRHYSVAEHCIRCSYIGPDDEALERLMHDAAEALVVDMPTPLKVMPGMEAYRAMDHAAERVIADRFGLTYPWPPSVRAADLIMLATEKRDLMPPGGAAWDVIKGITPDSFDISGGYFSRKDWKSEFIARFDELAGARGAR